MEEIKKCPYCGEEIKADAKKCRHCGEWLEHGSDCTHVAKNNNSKKIWLYIAIGVIMLIIVIALVLIFSSSNQETKASMDVSNSSFVEKDKIALISFDSKSLIALSRMCREEASNILNSSGWKYNGTEKETVELGDVSIEGDNVGYKDASEKYFIDILYLPIQGDTCYKETFVEFKTQSPETFEQWCHELENLGFTLYEDTETEVIHTVYCEKDSEDSPSIILKEIPCYGYREGKWGPTGKMVYTMTKMGIYE